MTSPLMLFYFVCAVFGGTVLIFQLVLLSFGIGGDSDIDTGFDADGGDSASVDVFRMLSFRTIIAGFAFFGLGGLIGLSGGWGPTISVLSASVCGVAAIVLVFYLCESIAKLQSSGSISEATLAGCRGEVYVSIPAAGEGTGKVLITQQDRTMEYEAQSTGEPLKTGTRIVVLRSLSASTVEVQPETNH